MLVCLLNTAECCKDATSWALKTVYPQQRSLSAWETWRSHLRGFILPGAMLCYCGRIGSGFSAWIQILWALHYVLISAATYACCKWGVGGRGHQGSLSQQKQSLPWCYFPFCWLLFLSCASSHMFNWLWELTWPKITHSLQIILFFKIVPLERLPVFQQSATWEAPLHGNLFQLNKINKARSHRYLY